MLHKGYTSRSKILAKSHQNGYTKVTQAAEAEPSSASTAPQNFEKIIKELNLYKTLACMSGRNMRKKYKQPAKIRQETTSSEQFGQTFEIFTLKRLLK